MKIDVVELVRQCKGNFEFIEICSEHGGKKLYIKVFRDAMKFDNIPETDFKREILSNKVFNGVRLPASAHELQQIADLLDCMLLTPKVIDLIWLQSELKFSPVINLGPNKIVAVQNIIDVHQEIERIIDAAGGDDGTKLIDSIGKYWVLINDLLYKGKLHGDETACNYGWCAFKASGPGILPGVQCWQRPGFRHNKQHLDPSQVIRLMHRKARLVKADGSEEEVDLYDVAKNPKLAPLLHHQPGTLKYLRQKGVSPELPIIQIKEDKINNDNTIDSDEIEEYRNKVFKIINRILKSLS